LAQPCKSSLPYLAWKVVLVWSRCGLGFVAAAGNVRRSAGCSSSCSGSRTASRTTRPSSSPRVPNWTVGETFSTGRGHQWRILAIDSDIAEELVDQGINAVFTVEQI
jgi:hypothetical protein